MKKHYFLQLTKAFRIYGSICFLLFFFQLTHAQIYYDTICWVWVNDADYVAAKGTDFSAKSDLNALFNQDQVVYYEQALPFAKTPELLKIHEIRCSSNADIDNVIGNLETSYSGKFDKFSKFEVMDSVFVYDPVDYMWTAHADDWLWHLKRIQADYAWDITKGDPSIFTAIVDADFDVTHPDLASEISPHYDPYSNYQYSCNTTHWHGTAVASFVSAETTEQGETPQGQLASVGFNTKIVAYMWDSRQNTLAKALHASNVMGADVFVSCAGGSLGCSPMPSTGEELIIKEILDNGTVIVMPAGNGPNSTSCGPAGNQHAFYPFNPEYDERIIIVTSTDFDDNHYWENTQGEEYTHSHFPEVDICSPGYDIMGAATTDCGGNTWPYYGSWGGTSFSSPIVAGVCALLKSVNPDFTPGEIQHFIKSTADPVTDANNYPGMLGAGRINAFKAVEMAYNCAPKEITANETWNDDKVIACGLEIKNNATLTINSQVKLSENSYIIIENGSELIINGGILTSLDNKMWQGIQVWGNKNESQQPLQGEPLKQGKLTLNNATIENAIIAVDLWKPGDYTTTGGMVYATNSVFRNNAKSAHALLYNNFNPYYPGIEWDYFSNFKNCTFEITEDYLGDETFYKHIDLAYVKGIDFQGCDFSLAENVEGVSTWNHAIAAYDARFRVSAICNSQQAPCPEVDYDRSTFTGFYNAISAVNDGGVPLTFSVNRADFTDNANGVKTRYMNNASVLFSNFEIGHLWGCGTGIYSDNVTGFAYEENDFTKFTGGSASNHFGVIINNSEAINEVYKNTFNGLSYANFSDGKNWIGINTYMGLAYYCNENANNYTDFYVNDFEREKRSGIQSEQGNDNYTAGNTFTQNGATWHFYNGGEHLVGYYYNQNNSNEIPDDDKIYHVAKYGRNINNGCPSHYGGSSELKLVLTTQQKADAEQEYYNNLTDYNNVKILYDSYVDGGDTEAEKLDIQTAQPEDMWELRAQLLGDSPHLSFEVLKEAADKTDVLTESALFDILAANPDELKKDTLLSYLENKEEPLPAYMVDLLRQLAQGTTYKTALHQQMAGYKHAYTRAAHDIIRSLLNDTVTDNVELRNWLDNLGGITSDRQIIATYISEDNFTGALTLANMLPQLYKLEGNELTEHNYYMDMLDLHQTLYQESRNTFQLDSTEKASIIFIANNSTGVAGAQAKSILEGVYDEYFDDCPDADGTAGYKSNSIINPDALGKAYGLNISVKPNPAKQWAAFDYTLPGDETEAIITISNSIGNIVEMIQISGSQGQNLWDTRTVKPGVYIYTIKAAGFSQSGKIVISK